MQILKNAPIVFVFFSTHNAYKKQQKIGENKQILDTSSIGGIHDIKRGAGVGDSTVVGCFKHCLFNRLGSWVYSLASRDRII
jgi:hypothetical protein